MKRLDAWMVEHGAPAIRWALAVMGLAAIATLLGALTGCSGPPDIARRGTTAAAIGLAAMDGPAAEGYTAAHEAALDASETRAEYDAAMRPWDELERGMRASRSALLALDAALDAWGAGGEEQWLGLAACVAVSLRDLATLAGAVGLDPPDEIDSALDIVGALATGACPGRQ